MLCRTACGLWRCSVTHIQDSRFAFSVLLLHVVHGNLIDVSPDGTFTLPNESSIIIYSKITAFRNENAQNRAICTTVSWLFLVPITLPLPPVSDHGYLTLSKLNLSFALQQFVVVVLYPKCQLRSSSIAGAAQSNGHDA